MTSKTVLNHFLKDNLNNLQLSQLENYNKIDCKHSRHLAVCAQSTKYVLKMSQYNFHNILL